MKYEDVVYGFLSRAAGIMVRPNQSPLRFEIFDTDSLPEKYQAGLAPLDIQSAVFAIGKSPQLAEGSDLRLAYSRGEVSSLVGDKDPVPQGKYTVVKRTKNEIWLNITERPDGPDFQQRYIFEKVNTNSADGRGEQYTIDGTKIEDGDTFFHLMGLPIRRDEAEPACSDGR